MAVNGGVIKHSYAIFSQGNGNNVLLHASHTSSERNHSGYTDQPVATHVRDKSLKSLKFILLGIAL